MVRRTTSQAKRDDAAFGLRLKLVIPRGGWGFERLRSMDSWLRDLPPGDSAFHGGGYCGRSEVSTLYLRSIDVAQRFFEAFPEVELADGTTLSTYQSPALPFGRREE